jgi:catalase
MTTFVTRQRLTIAIAVSSLVMLIAPIAAPTAEIATASAATPVEVIESLEGTFGIHQGERRNHAKGTCAVGEFVATAGAPALSRSQLFSGASIPVVARFSVAGGNPNVSDATRNARGMALEFRLPDGSRQHMTMLNTPAFGAANPDTFNDMILAAKPDPKTGKPDQPKLRQFLASHPDALAQSDFLARNNPPESYANSAYYGIHTFKFIDTGGAAHAVKWRFIPRGGEKHMASSELASAPNNFLELRLIEQVAKSPVQWDMVVYVGEPGDSEDNPTITWPETRTHFKAGTLTIKQAIPQSGAECEKINFDPLVMADGIAPTNDPVLLFRSPAYAISFAKRLSNK